MDSREEHVPREETGAWTGSGSPGAERQEVVCPGGQRFRGSRGGDDPEDCVAVRQVGERPVGGRRRQLGEG